MPNIFGKNNVLYLVRDRLKLVNSTILKTAQDASERTHFFQLLFVNITKKIGYTKLLI